MLLGIRLLFLGKLPLLLCQNLHEPHCRPYLFHRVFVGSVLVLPPHFNVLRQILRMNLAHTLVVVRHTQVVNLKIV